MTSSKQPKGTSESRDDLDRYPGIGQSKASFATGVPPSAVAGENTVEGDVDNDSTGGDGVPQRKRERSNA
jgi:hypothetical protein